MGCLDLHGSERWGVALAMPLQSEEIAGLSMSLPKHAIVSCCDDGSAILRYPHPPRGPRTSQVLP
jgi:hypothetical protein